MPRSGDLAPHGLGAFSELAVAREQHERPSLGDGQHGMQFRVEPFLVPACLLVVEAGRDVEHGLLLEIKGRVEQQFRGASRPRRFLIYVKRSRCRERCRGEHDGLGLAEEIFPQRFCHVDGRGNETVAHVLALGPVHEALGALLEIHPDRGRHGLGAVRQRP